MNKNFPNSLLVFGVSMLGLGLINLLECLISINITPMSVTSMVGFSAVIAFIHYGYVR